MNSHTPSVPPPARRLRVTPWRDRRVLVGLVIVLVSAVAGSALIASSRATQTRWELVEDVRAGQPVSRSQVRPVEVWVPGSVGATLLPADASLTRGRWARDLGRGSVVTVDAVATESVAGQLLPLRVPVGSIPDGVRVGDRVNIWVGPGPQTTEVVEASRILTEVPVVENRDDPTGTHRLLVVDVGVAGPVPAVVAAVATAHLTVVRVR